jgi:hypothetical protein
MYSYADRSHLPSGALKTTPGQSLPASVVTLTDLPSPAGDQSPPLETMVDASNPSAKS